MGLECHREGEIKKHTTWNAGEETVMTMNDTRAEGANKLLALTNASAQGAWGRAYWGSVGKSGKVWIITVGSKHAGETANA